ncbi:MAG: GspH/FimT family pseudopilin [Gammaproteobacteria bacterium]|nr:GspH/FimT family pseudopilin [Gammaproteobacteria bacterium]
MQSAGRGGNHRTAGPAAVTRHGRGASGITRGRGFSLLEVLLVVAIIAIASLLATAAMSGGFEGLQLRASAKEIAANLRYTRAQAIATGQPQRFTIDPRAHTWQAPNGRDGEIPEKLGIVFTGAREVQPRADEGAILFFADGAATGGRVQLQSSAKRGVRRAAWDIDVAWLTGEVRLKRSEADR